MTNLTPIWTPQDSIDTAQAFNLELANAERGQRRCLRCDRSHFVVRIDGDGVCRRCKRFGRIFNRSRFRRAKFMDAIAVTLLMALMAMLGVVVFAASAKADDSRAYAYAATYGGVVCEVLDDGHDSVAGLVGIGRAIMEDGLTAYEAGQVLAISVTEICPWHTDVLDRFIGVYGRSARQIA